MWQSILEMNKNIINLKISSVFTKIYSVLISKVGLLIHSLNCLQHKNTPT